MAEAASPRPGQGNGVMSGPTSKPLIIGSAAALGPSERPEPQEQGKPASSVSLSQRF